MTVAELISELSSAPQGAHVLILGMAGPVEMVIGFPESGAPNKVFISSDPERD